MIMNQYSYNMPNTGYNMSKTNFRPNQQFNTGDRFIGGAFLGPFLLGGITGGLLAPAFYPRPMYGPPIYRPYPVYPVPNVTNQYFY